MRAPALSAHGALRALLSLRALGALGALGLGALCLAAPGCSPSNGPSLGDECSLDQPCKEGVCNLSGGGGDPVCIEAEGDVDGDGLLNKADFCNQKAGGAFDEDGDGLGDDCDPCPIARPPAQAETDGDGVDTPCDPDPTMAGNKITLFEGFNGTIPATWRNEGAWQVRGGEAVFTAADPNTVAILTVPLATSSRHLAIQTSYRVNRVDATASQNLAGVVSIDRRPAGVTTVACSGSRIGTMDSLDVTTGVGNATKSFANLFDAAGLYKIAQLIDNATGSCAMSAGSQEGAVTSTTSGEIPTEAGLSARAVDVRFQYLLFVQRP